MDVERLMRDLTVEQLENIHTSLQKEMEQKKEELREMVGRRYRDVLEASTQVRETHARAASLAECVSKARSSGHAETPRAPRDETRALLGFIALQRLLPAVGAENEGADALSDVFALLLAEQIHRQLMTEQNAAVVSLVVHGLSTRLSRLRRWLVESLYAELCELSRPDWVSVQLAALAILLNQSLEQLLESYLDARKKHISALLQGESSLLTVVEEIKFTLQVVDRLFVRGDLSSVLQAASAIGYRPALLETIVCDQTFAFHSYLNAEIEKINRTQRDRKLVPLTTQKISDKCTLWMDAVCDMATSSVATICAFYDSPQAVLEFLRALAIVMNQEWPRAASCTALYQKMFGTAVLDKFKALVCADAAELSNKLSTGLSETPLAPPPLFEKRSTNQYDPILATGISKPLQSHVLSFFNGVHALRDLCMQYEKAGLETDASSAREALAAAVAEQLIQLGSTVSCPLSKARLCLAALQADPVLACQSLNKDAHHIQRCSKALSQTAEDGLSAHVCGLVSEAMSEEAFQAYISATSDPLKALELSSEWEQVDLPDVGRLQVPVAPTASLCAPILALCRIISSTSLTHLLSRNVRRNLATAVSERLIPVLQRVISTDSTFAQRINIQILFDAKVLITVLPCEGMRSILPAIESRIDPFELAVLTQPMSSNVRLAASRAQLLWACLLPDMMPLRDTTLSPSFIAVSDVVARPKDHPQRIPAIPRLDRAIGEDGLKRMRSRDTRNNKLLAGADARVKGSGTSLTSLYERVTGGWFGN